MIDALLGAAALGDIGTLFPDTDESYRDARSVVLLEEAARRVHAAGFGPGSIDVTVFLKRPKLGPYVRDMRASLALAVGIPADAVSVKAKSMNRVGPVGEGSAYAAQAVAVVTRSGDGR